MIDFTDYRDLYAKYDTLTKISFDYAVVEKEPSIQVMRYAGEWKDVGSWNIMAEVMADKAFAFSVFDTSFQVLLCIDGSGEIETENIHKQLRLKKGDCVFLPAGLGRCHIVGELELLKIRC